MHNYHEVAAAAHLNQQTRLEEAANWRLARTAETYTSNTQSSYRPLLAGVGRALSRIGDELQSKYGQDSAPRLAKQL